MKVKLEIEADEKGYTKRLSVDGKLIYEQVSKANDTGTETVSATKIEDIPDEYLELYDEIDNFQAYDLHAFVRRRED